MPISRKIRYLAIPTLLVTVALNHGWRYVAYQQSSWGAGCGFGMFATVDYHGTRFFRATLVSGSVVEPAGFRSQFPIQDLRARVLPSDKNLRSYAEALADQSWRIVTPPDLLPVTTTGTTQPPGERCFELTQSPHDALPLDQVRLTVWGIDFTPRKRRIRAFPIRTVEVSK